MASVKNELAVDSGKIIAHMKNNNQFNLKNLRISLKYRPKMLQFILSMRHCIRKKNLVIKKLKERLKALVSHITYNYFLVQSSIVCIINVILYCSLIHNA